MTKVLSEKEKAKRKRDTERNRWRRHNDPEYAQRVRETNRRAAARRRADPVKRAHMNAVKSKWEKHQRATNPEYRRKRRELNRIYMAKLRADPKKKMEYERKRGMKRLENSPNQRLMIIQRENRMHNWPRGKQRCIDCGVVKPLDKYNFVACKGLVTGLRGLCRECDAARKRAYRERQEREAAA